MSTQTAKTPDVSVIIPIFNMEEYLKDALDSVLAQTLRKIEVICVNDGSTDNSINILNEYAAKDARVVIIDRENRGVGISRNDGMRAATGKFIAFLDPDDRFAANDVLEALYRNAVEHNAKICGGSLCRIYDNTVDYRVIPGYEKQAFSQCQMRDYANYQYHYGFYRFIYEREMLIENNIFFPSYIRYQDPPFMVQAMLKAERFYAMDKIVYAYRKSHKKLKWSEDRITAMLSAVSEVWQVACERNFNELKGHIYQDLCGVINAFRNKMTPSQHLFVKQVEAEIFRLRGSSILRLLYDSMSSKLDSKKRFRRILGMTFKTKRNKRKTKKTTYGATGTQQGNANPLISVIVPVYNTSAYLRKCLDSICQQTYKNLEIICVNDGSTDDSASILEEYAAADSRIVVITQENAGLSAARNAALEIAKGEWVTGIDSDDYVDLDTFESVISALNIPDVSIVFYGMRRIDGESGRIKFRFSMPATGVQKVTPQLVKSTIAVFCNKLWRTELFQKTGLRFPAGLWFEDNAMFNRVAPYVEKIYYLPKFKYNYVSYGNSIMDNASQGDAKLMDRIKVMDVIFRHYAENPLPKHMESMPEHILLHHYKMLFEYLPESMHDEAWAAYQGIIEKYGYKSLCLKNLNLSITYHCHPSMALGLIARMSRLEEIESFLHLSYIHQRNIRDYRIARILQLVTFGRTRRKYKESCRSLKWRIRNFRDRWASFK